MWIKKHLVYATLIFSIIYISACSESSTTEPENNDDMNEPSTLSSIQVQVFDKSCAFTGCHAGSNPAAGMDLISGKAYSNLVNVTANLNSNFNRVEPGSSGNSFIIKMMRNSGESTRQMPPSGKLDESLIQYVEKWIDEGAKNN